MGHPLGGVEGRGGGGRGGGIAPHRNRHDHRSPLGLGRWPSQRLVGSVQSPGCKIQIQDARYKIRDTRYGGCKSRSHSVCSLSPDVRLQGELVVVGGQFNVSWREELFDEGGSTTGGPSVTSTFNDVLKARASSLLLCKQVWPF